MFKTHCATCGAPTTLGIDTRMLEGWGGQWRCLSRTCGALNTEPEKDREAKAAPDPEEGTHGMGPERAMLSLDAPASRGGRPRAQASVEEIEAAKAALRDMRRLGGAGGPPRRLTPPEQRALAAAREARSR